MRLHIVLALASSLLATPALADGMRCGTKLVSDGDSTYDVRSRCGEPAAASRRVELRTVRSWVNGPCTVKGAPCGHMVEHTVEVVVEEWTYDMGPHEFIRYLRFEQDKLLSVTTGDYGNPR